MKFVPFLYAALFTLAVTDAEMCTDCWPPSSGPCKQDNGVCHSYMPDGTCPPGTEPCDPAARGFTVEDWQVPTKIEINIWLKSEPDHNIWTRFLVFYKGSREKKVAVPFFRKSSALLEWNGKATSANELNDIRTMVEPGNRDFWDDMSFENRGGSTYLDIDKIEVWIEYGNSNMQLKRMMIAREKDEQLSQPQGSVKLTNWRGRKFFAKEYFDLTEIQYQNLPDIVKDFIKDLGKSGSDGGSDNPKYGIEQAPCCLCTETVTWYLHEDPTQWIWIDTNLITFENLLVHYDMFNLYLMAGRLYCYNHYYKQWRLREAVASINPPYYRTNVEHIQNHAKKTSGGYAITYGPKPGDYLNRLTRIDEDGYERDGHSMMVVKWNFADYTMRIVEGPYPVTFRNITLFNKEENHEFDYCVGRTPANGP